MIEDNEFFTKRLERVESEPHHKFDPGELRGPYPSPVPQTNSGEDIVNSIARFIERFVFLSQRELYGLIALWVIATHMYQDFEYMGYLFASSPEPQSGKSRLLEVLGLLVANSSGILVSPSEAVLFRTAAGQTQLLDEVDSWVNRDELRSVLNAGFHREGKVARMKEGVNDYEVREFPVYAPRVLAGIGKKILSATTRDRTFGIEMLRQKHVERRERFRLKRIRPEAEELKSAIEQWILDNRAAVCERNETDDFPYLDDFGDRTIDITQPLASILEIALRDLQNVGAARADLVVAVSITRDENELSTQRHRVLNALSQLAKKSDPLVGSASELSDLCANVIEKPEEGLVSETLRTYGFETASKRIKGGEPRYRYVLSAAELENLVARYAKNEGVAPVEGLAESANECPAASPFEEAVIH